MSSTIVASSEDVYKLKYKSGSQMASEVSTLIIKELTFGSFKTLDGVHVKRGVALHRGTL